MPEDIEDILLPQSEPRYYASLTGPLLGLFYPLPFADGALNVAALATSKLANLRCATYSAEEAALSIEKHGGILLPADYADRLDYNRHRIEELRRRRRNRA